MSSLLDAIGTAGTALDRFTGGRAIRGLLAGRPRELMSVVPFSETMGLTSPDEVTSGRDLLNQYGLTDPQSKGWGPMLGGMAVEMATSPLSYLGGFGAAKAAPKLAAEATGLAERVAPAAGKFLAEESGSLSPAIVAQRAAELAGKLGFKPTEVSPVLRKALESTAARTMEEVAAGGAPSPRAMSKLVPQLTTGPKTWNEVRQPAQILDDMTHEWSQKLASQLAGRVRPVTEPQQIGLTRSFLNPPKLPRGSEKANALLESLGKQWEGGLSSLAQYSGPKYRLVNRYLRDVAEEGPDALEAELAAMRHAGRQAADLGIPVDPEDARTMGGQILNMLEQGGTPQPLQLYRGIDRYGINDIGDILGVPLTSKRAMGRTLFEPAPLSTSLSRDVASEFAERGGPGGVLFDLGKVPKGKPALYMNPTEQEVLFAPGRRLQLEKILSRPDLFNEGAPTVIRARLLQALLAAMGAGGAGYAALQDQSAPTLPASPAA